MKSVIKWAVENSPAMNTLMAALLVMGAIGMLSMRREVFPEFDLEIVLVSVPYPGASPAEVEEGICQKLEEAVRSISGIKKQTAVAREGGGFLVLELEGYVKNPQKIVNEVRSEIDQVKSRLPENAEDPEIQQLTIREAAIRIGVIAPENDAVDAELQLRDIAEHVRDDLLLLPTVSQVSLVGVKDFQIDVEIDEQTLRKYGLTLDRVAAIIRRENIELPGGVIKTDSEEVLLRGKNKGLTGKEIARIPVIRQPNGVVLTVGDLGVVRDEFVDDTSVNEVNGRPAVVLSVDRTASEDLLQIVAEVKHYVQTARQNGRIPEGYDLLTWADRSVDVRDRMVMLARNGVQGLVLVFLVLSLFLDLRLAFWVAIGIPVAVLGAGAYLWLTGETLNMLSMFAFLMALGIVVDDAIVIGENIYEHRMMGKPFTQAAIDGAYEVIPSVVASVGTTVIAFVPLLFVAGVMGKFIAVMPVAVIAMLIISLLESTFVLPCHLAHEDNLFLRILAIPLYPFRVFAELIHWSSIQTEKLMSTVIQRFYSPALAWAIRNPATMMAGGFTIFLLAVGVVRSGITPYEVFPKLDSNWIQGKVVYPDGTPAAVTNAATLRLAAALSELRDKPGDGDSADGGRQIVRVQHRTVGQVTGAGPQGPESRTSGSHVGAVEVELVDTSDRQYHSEEILRLWRERAGEFPGAESVVFGTPAFGPGGAKIEFKLLARAEDMDELEAAAEEAKAKLATYEGVFDIRDDSTPGKWEFQFTVKDRAKALGKTAADLAETVRASYFGAEAMRLQRGRHEVKLMVRYPRDQRESLANFENIRVDGMIPITELADVEVSRGYSEINRVDQMRSITITADVDATKGNAAEIVADLRPNAVYQLVQRQPSLGFLANFLPANPGWESEMLKQYPGISFRWEGEAEQNAESVQSMVVGLGIAILAMFVLLTLEFRSYLQPLLVLMIIPFGFVGAVFGHWLMGLPLTIFTMFGFVALTGVVVNDSIVLIDFINHRVRDGVKIADAINDAGQRRFRPIFLTSITTIAGLLPLLTETSFQAQILIPMAATLAFGLLVATPLILFLVPTFYSAYIKLMTPHSIHESVSVEPAEVIETSVVQEPPAEEASGVYLVLEEHNFEDSVSPNGDEDFDRDASPDASRIGSK